MTERRGRYVACDIDMTLQAGDWYPELKTEADKGLDTLVGEIKKDRAGHANAPLFFGSVSGRTLESQRKEVEAKSGAYQRAVKEMDLLIGSVGAEMALRKGASFVPVAGWPGRLSGWNREKAQHVLESTADLGALELQGDMTQSANKLSYFVEMNERRPGDYAKRVQALLGKAGVKTTVIYSGGRYLDILPRLASGKEVDKGAAIGHGARLLADEHSLAAAPEVIAAGDSENDEAAFGHAIESGGKAVIPGNAKKEFKTRMRREYPASKLYIARKALAAGVHEGLIHFNVLAPLK